MSSALFEIVPNLSEGRDRSVIDDAVAMVGRSGARLLHRTSDETHHRSVLTIAGSGEQVLEASIALAGVASARIDLRQHRGVHPRIGALDVLPFVPLRNATLEGAVALAHRAGSAIWQRYRIPSFYYGAAARHEARRQLSTVRSGEFEGLAKRFADPGWAPDEGDVGLHASAGAIAIGARDILVALNVELATGELGAAREIARLIRERDGGLRTLRALAFPRGETRVQVSLNVTDYSATPLYRIVELIRALAARRGVELAATELIGCLPRAAVETAAAYYLGVSTV
ncbi:MAG: glutamate formimidoyltransferase [Candidatus Eremiobacteraeota bacterium]|nr:glutamate formimidoyltransferase [Candidatus Eremiobacteraeota bacterium]MBV8375177.1 glutamate formimidoyltransferase [Candidatus Eremiobacteraeota bacterium]